MHIAQAVRTIVPLGLAAALFGAGCGGDDFTLSSPDIANGTIQQEQVANVFGCHGGNVSPELRWSNPPDGTQSFAITVHDPDAPTGSGFWHWAVFDIPASTTSLPKNAGNPSANLAPAGSIQGFTDFAKSQYGGPCPPTADAPHRYVFTIYALKVATLGLDNSAPGALVSFSAKGNAIGSASFTANYGTGSKPNGLPSIPTANGFTLASGQITNGGTIPTAQVFNQFGCTGQNQSPSLQWSGVPAGTQSLVLQMYDPDAPTDSGFWHWVVFNIPPTQTSILLGAGSPGGIPGSAVQGTNDYGKTGYGGPCPPAGAAPHHYQFTLYALKVANLKDPAVAGIPDNATGGLVGFVTRANATAQASFTATYGR
ncbi:MAG: YbhB/YbcL family Raf kinase inhibitor-like protein [Myxococcales bacterium]